MTVRTRFAPSPTGYMHIGNLRTALYAYLFARNSGGTFILRIEDTDQQRLIEGAADVIFRSLKTAGLHWDEGPDVGGPHAPYVQSERKELFAPYAWALVEKGGAYPCFCTKERLDALRADCQSRGETFKYDKTCRALSKGEAKARIDAGEPYVIRQDVPQSGIAAFDDVLFGHIEVDVSTLDDAVLLKSDGMPTYNFAHVVDDHLMGVTHVLRGSEFLSSTPRYNLLYDAFGWDKPVYVHLSPVMADAHRKLSKRLGDPTFEDLLGEGFLSQAIVNYVALLGWSPGDDCEMFTLAELEKAFSLEGLSKSPAIFDKNKLLWFNAQYLRAMSPEAFLKTAKPWLMKALPDGRVDLLKLCALLQPRVEALSQLPEMVKFLLELPEDFSLALFEHKKMKTDIALSRTVVSAAYARLQAQQDWSEQALHDALLSLVSELGVKNGQVLYPVRVALTGLASTPGGAPDAAYLLGRDESLRRMALSLERLGGAN